MNIDYQFLCKDKRLFRNITGMDQYHFELLLPAFEENVKKVKEKRALSKKRVRAPGGGRKPKHFNTPFKLMFYVRFFVRIYPTFDLAVFIFGIDRSILHYWFEIGLEALELTVMHKIPIPAKKSKTVEDLLGVVPELKHHLVDATEQPINRPKYNQKKYYSGKKKRHTKKRHVVTTPEGMLVGISGTVEGKMHDKKLAEEDQYLLRAPPDSTLIGDTAYIGDYPEAQIGLRVVTPIKKKPGIERSDTDKVFNKVISSIRVKAENVICHLKYNRMFSDKLRYRKDIYDDRVANIVGGLYNYVNGF